MRVGGWQHAPVNVLKDADIVGIGRTEDQNPERAACNASSAGLYPMLRVFGLLGSSTAPGAPRSSATPGTWSTYSNPLVGPT